MIGNNPIELSKVYEMILNFKKKRFVAITAFKLQDGVGRFIQYQPQCVLIDDSIGEDLIKLFIQKLHRHRNPEYKKVPLILLKSSAKVEMPSFGISDFLLKATLSSDNLCRAILKSIKFRHLHRKWEQENRDRMEGKEV